MLTATRHLLGRMLWSLPVGSDYMRWRQLQRHGFLSEMGWFRSQRERMPVDRDGNPLPWLTYACIEFLRHRVRPDWSVFEFGSGGSTRWWAARVGRLVSVEHDRAWYERMAPLLPPKVEYLHHDLVPGGAYCQSILAFAGEFDVVVIDGRDRVNCARNCVPALRPAGIVIWDNSERDKYAEGYAFLQGHGFRRIDFTGLGPVNLNGWSTALFYRDGNCLGI
jgi:hypothetical protein